MIGRLQRSENAIKYALNARRNGLRSTRSGIHHLSGCDNVGRRHATNRKREHQPASFAFIYRRCTIGADGEFSSTDTRKAIGSFYQVLRGGGKFLDACENLTLLQIQ